MGKYGTQKKEEEKFLQLLLCMFFFYPLILFFVRLNFFFSCYSLLSNLFPDIFFVPFQTKKKMFARQKKTGEKKSCRANTVRPGYEYKKEKCKKTLWFMETCLHPRKTAYLHECIELDRKPSDFSQVTGSMYVILFHCSFLAFW